MDRAVNWFAMPVGVQISNVGSEVHRAIRWKNKGDEQKKDEKVFGMNFAKVYQMF